MSSAWSPSTHSELVTRALRRHPTRIAFDHAGASWTYAQTADLIGRVVTVLRKAGLRPGEGIGLLSPNRPEVWIAQVAPGFVGCSYTALHPMGSLEDHVYSCDEAALRFLFVDPAYAERGAALLDKASSVERIFTFGPCEVGDDLIALAAAAEPSRLEDCRADPDTISWLLYTGGTTGVPKAVELPERAVAQMTMSVSLGWDLPAERRYLATSPVSHAAGMMVTATLLGGGTTYMLPGWDPSAWLTTVEREKITVALLVPTMIYSLLDYAGLDAADTSSLQTIMYGASPMAPARLIEGLERIGLVFCQLYGQTECAGIITSLWRQDHDPTRPDRLASCGQAMPGVRISLRDDDNNEVETGTPGEVCVQGPSVMKGYLNQPEMTAETLLGGWLHTGDIAICDDEGFYSLVDRKKDMIVSGGFNVFPSEIERVLAEDPAVSAAAVIGVPDVKWGEAVKAFVVPRPGATIDVEALIALAKRRKGSHCAPKSIEIVDILPVTAVGKIDKKSLRDRYWDAQQRKIN